MKKVILNIQYICNKVQKIPNKSTFMYWIKKTLPMSNKIIEITIRLVNENEICNLNMKYRNKNYPTNILSFPFIHPFNINMKILLLGDLVICPKIIEYEAFQQNRSFTLHWAHIVVHGVLHLLGYDHVSNKQLKNMKIMEIKILKRLGYSQFKF